MFSGNARANFAPSLGVACFLAIVFGLNVTQLRESFASQRHCLMLCEEGKELMAPVLSAWIV